MLEQNSDSEWDRVLVFVATRYATEHVSRKLRRYGISAAELHGKLDQDARERRLKSFRSGKTRVLISTDLAARGIDVEALPVVVNYDLPRSTADFTHRTGRTGRAGKIGTAISFVSAKSEAHFDLIENKELVMQKIEREVLPNFAPNEEDWKIVSTASTMSVPGATHSDRGLAHDRMFGGVKGRRKSKKDKLREEAAARAARENLSP
jgi:superfamily II DNA/RNA helicase